MALESGKHSCSLIHYLIIDFFMGTFIFLLLTFDHSCGISLSSPLVSPHIVINLSKLIWHMPSSSGGPSSSSTSLECLSIDRVVYATTEMRSLTVRCWICWLMISVWVTVSDAVFTCCVVGWRCVGVGALTWIVGGIGIGVDIAVGGNGTWVGSCSGSLLWLYSCPWFLKRRKVVFE